MDHPDQRRQAILDELARIEENARYTGVTHFVSAQHHKWLHHWLVGPLPILLGGVGAWNGFTNASHVSGAFAALAGISGSLLSFWNFTDARAKHQTAGAAFKSIEHDARRIRLVDGPTEETSALRDRLEEIAQRYNKLCEASVHTSQFAFKRAQTLLSSGAYTNTVDQARAQSENARPQISATSSQQGVLPPTPPTSPSKN